MKKKPTYNFRHILTLFAVCFIGLGAGFSWHLFFRSDDTRPDVSDVPVFDRNDFATNGTQAFKHESIKTEKNEMLPMSQKTAEPETQIFGSQGIENQESGGENGTEIADDTTPASINLDVPFTSQAPEADWIQPWQDACEEATVIMLHAYYHGYDLSIPFVKKEIVKMVSYQDQIGWGYSIDINTLAKVYEWYSANAGQKGTVNQFSGTPRVIENPTVDNIKKFIANGHPVLAVARGKDLPNPYYTGDGPEYHTLIIRGYTKDSFITNDPGTKRGENFVYAYNDLMSALHDWNDGDVIHGTPAILVVKY